MAASTAAHPVRLARCPPLWRASQRSSGVSAYQMAHAAAWAIISPSTGSSTQASRSSCPKVRMRSTPSNPAAVGSGCSQASRSRVPWR